jgi:hypothetical protein
MSRYSTIETFYLSDEANVARAQDITGMSENEIVSLVGRFGKNSQRAGLVRGEAVLFDDGTGVIRHHFTKKIITRFDYET